MARRDQASRDLESTPARIYRALVDPDILVRWLPPPGAEAKIDAFEARPGGRFEITLTFTPDSGAAGKTTASTDVVKGRFVDLVPDRSISQEFTFESADPSFSGTMRMSWALKPSACGTTVSVTAEDVPPGISQDVHEAAMASSLASLEALLAAGEGGGPRRPEERAIRAPGGTR